MLSQTVLREQFEALLRKQQDAVGIYESAGDRFADPQTRSQIDQVCREKKRHVELTRRLLEILG
jgi:rubrerythrin